MPSAEPEQLPSSPHCAVSVDADEERALAARSQDDRALELVEDDRVPARFQLIERSLWMGTIVAPAMVIARFAQHIVARMEPITEATRWASGFCDAQFPFLRSSATAIVLAAVLTVMSCVYLFVRLRRQLTLRPRYLLPPSADAQPTYRATPGRIEGWSRLRYSKETTRTQFAWVMISSIFALAACAWLGPARAPFPAISEPMGAGCTSNIELFTFVLVVSLLPLALVVRLRAWFEPRPRRSS